MLMRIHERPDNYVTPGRHQSLESGRGLRLGVSVRIRVDIWVRVRVWVGLDSYHYSKGERDHAGCEVREKLSVAVRGRRGQDRG